MANTSVDIGANRSNAVYWPTHDGDGKTMTVNQDYEVPYGDEVAIKERKWSADLCLNCLNLIKSVIKVRRTGQSNNSWTYKSTTGELFWKEFGQKIKERCLIDIFLHPGIDVGKANVPIYSVAWGEVLDYRNTNSSFKWGLKIRHKVKCGIEERTFIAAYYHLTDSKRVIPLSSGTKVYAGQKLFKGTDDADNHLHFEIHDAKTSPAGLGQWPKINATFNLFGFFLNSQNALYSSIKNYADLISENDGFFGGTNFETLAGFKANQSLYNTVDDSPYNRNKALFDQYVVGTSNKNGTGDTVDEDVLKQQVLSTGPDILTDLISDHSNYLLDSEKTKIATLGLPSYYRNPRKYLKTLTGSFVTSGEYPSIGLNRFGPSFSVE